MNRSPKEYIDLMRKDEAELRRLSHTLTEEQKTRIYQGETGGGALLYEKLKEYEMASDSVISVTKLNELTKSLVNVDCRELFVIGNKDSIDVKELQPISSEIKDALSLAYNFTELKKILCYLDNIGSYQGLFENQTCKPSGMDGVDLGKKPSGLDAVDMGEEARKQGLNNEELLRTIHYYVQDRLVDVDSVDSYEINEFLKKFEKFFLPSKEVLHGKKRLNTISFRSEVAGLFTHVKNVIQDYEDHSLEYKYTMELLNNAIKQFGGSIEEKKDLPLCLPRPENIYEEELDKIAANYFSGQDLKSFMGYKTGGKEEKEKKEYIVWNDNWGKLSYLIKVLYCGEVHNGDIDTSKQMPKDIYKIAANIFVDKKGNHPSETTLKNVATSKLQQYKPDIDRVMKGILLRVKRFSK